MTETEDLQNSWEEFQNNSDINIIKNNSVKKQSPQRVEPKNYQNMATNIKAWSAMSQNHLDGTMNAINRSQQQQKASQIKISEYSLRTIIRNLKISIAQTYKTLCMYISEQEQTNEHLSPQYLFELFCSLNYARHDSITDRNLIVNKVGLLIDRNIVQNNYFEIKDIARFILALELLPFRNPDIQCTGDLQVQGANQFKKEEIQNKLTQSNIKLTNNQTLRFMQEVELLQKQNINVYTQKDLTREKLDKILYQEEKLQKWFDLAEKVSVLSSRKMAYYQKPVMLQFEKEEKQKRLGQFKAGDTCTFVPSLNDAAENDKMRASQLVNEYQKFQKLADSLIIPAEEKSDQSEKDVSKSDSSNTKQQNKLKKTNAIQFDPNRVVKQKQQQFLKQFKLFKKLLEKYQVATSEERAIMQHLYKQLNAEYQQQLRERKQTQECIEAKQSLFTSTFVRKDGANAFDSLVSDSKRRLEEEKEMKEMKLQSNEQQYQQQLITSQIKANDINQSIYGKTIYDTKHADKFIGRHLKAQQQKNEQKEIYDNLGFVKIDYSQQLSDQMKESCNKLSNNYYIQLKQPILQLEINITQTKTAKILIYENDQPQLVALNFCVTHQIQLEKYLALKQILEDVFQQNSIQYDKEYHISNEQLILILEKKQNIPNLPQKANCSSLVMKSAVLEQTDGENQQQIIQQIREIKPSQQPLSSGFDESAGSVLKTQDLQKPRKETDYKTQKKQQEKELEQLQLYQQQLMEEMGLGENKRKVGKK